MLGTEGSRSRRALACAAALAALSPAGRAVARECLGAPPGSVWVQGAYDDEESLTATAGAGIGKAIVTANWVKLKQPANGSKLTSMGVGLGYDLAPDGDRERRFQACATARFQVGRGWLVNADGLHQNARMDNRYLGLGLGLSYRLVGSAHGGVLLFATPRVTFANRGMQLYDRNGTSDVPTSDTFYGSELGAAAALGPVYARGAYVYTKDQPGGWTVALGVGW
jgi:hypothetical protein